MSPIQEWSMFWIVVAGIVFLVPAITGWVVLLIDLGIKEDLFLFALGHVLLVFWPLLVIYAAFLFVVGCTFILYKLTRFLLKEPAQTK